LVLKVNTDMTVSPADLPVSIHQIAKCPQTVDTLSARFEVKAPTGKRTLTLYRRGDEVMHVGREAGLAEYWRRLPNGHIAHTRLFEDYKRGIEYEPADLASVSGMPNWDGLRGLLPVAVSELNEAGGDECNRFVAQDADFGLIIYSPEIDLLAYRATQGPDSQADAWIKRESVSFDKTKIDRAFEMRLGYDMVDFADVGDMENDADLAKMMSRSFVEKREGNHAHNH